MRRLKIAAPFMVLFLLASPLAAEPALRIGRITVEGNARTDARTIIAESWLDEGDLFSEEEVARAAQRVMNLRLFESVEVRRTEAEAADRIDLTIVVVERITWGVMPIIGDEGDDATELGLSLEENNLFGTGAEVGGAFAFTDEARRYRLNWFAPQVGFSRRFFAGAGGYLSQFDYEDYDAEMLAGYLTAGVRPSYETAVALTLWAREDSFDDIAIDPDRLRTHEIDLGVSYDAVDYGIELLRGLGASLLLEQGVTGLGGDYEYTKGSIGLSWYRRMREDQTLGLRLVGGVGEDAPSHEQFTVGGAGSVRGYPSGARRGDRLLRGSISYEAPLWRAKALGYSGTLAAIGFVDGGAAWSDGEDPDAITGLGLGLRGYMTELQAFTFAFDLGYAPEENEFRPHLSIGAGF